MKFSRCVRLCCVLYAGFSFRRCFCLTAYLPDVCFSPHQKSSAFGQSPLPFCPVARLPRLPSITHHSPLTPSSPSNPSPLPEGISASPSHGRGYQPYFPALHTYGIFIVDNFYPVMSWQGKSVAGSLVCVSRLDFSVSC
jgi:hypothetical protein